MSPRKRSKTPACRKNNLPTYEYQCSACNTRVEHFLKIADRNNPGPCVCGGTLRRIVTSPNLLIDGADPSFPGAAMKWDADRQRIMAREQKNLQDHGEAYPNKRYV